MENSIKGLTLPKTRTPEPFKGNEGVEVNSDTSIAGVPVPFDFEHPVKARSLFRLR